MDALDAIGRRRSRAALDAMPRHQLQAAVAQLDGKGAGAAWTKAQLVDRLYRYQNTGR